MTKPAPFSVPCYDIVLVTKAVVFVLALLFISACTRNPFGAYSPTVTRASSVVDLSTDLDKSTFFSFFVADRFHLIAVVAKARESARIISYDTSGRQIGEFPVPDFADSPLVRDIVVDGDGNVGLLKAGKKGTRVEVLDRSGHVVHEYPLNQDAQRIVFTLRQIFALTNTSIIRVDDGSVFTRVPKDNYHLFATSSAKLAVISQTLPLMYTFDLATSAQRTYVLKTPEITSAINWSNSKKRDGPYLLIFSAAVDSRGTFYGAISPYSADLRLKRSREVTRVCSARVTQQSQTILRGKTTNNSQAQKRSSGVSHSAHYALRASNSRNLRRAKQRPAVRRHLHRLDQGGTT